MEKRSFEGLWKVSQDILAESAIEVCEETRVSNSRKGTAWGNAEVKSAVSTQAYTRTPFTICKTGIQLQREVHERLS